MDEALSDIAFPDSLDRDRLLELYPEDAPDRLGALTRLRTRLTLRPLFGKLKFVGDERAEIEAFVRRAHHPRAVQLCGWDPFATAFWATLVIAGGGIGAPALEAKSPPKGTPVSKAHGSIPSAVDDLKALRYFYNPTRIGSPRVVLPSSVSRSAGYFSHTVWLVDPAADVVERGIESICHWIGVNSHDPEFSSVQINFCFSGHAARGSQSGKSVLFLHGRWLLTESIVDLILDGLVERKIKGDNCRITLFLDCCFAACVARDFRVHLFKKRKERAGDLLFGTVWCRAMFCSSLSDEQSFDEVGLGHSYFTAGYLKENSSKRVPRHYPELSTISLRSVGSQTPVLIKFAPEQPPEMRLPVASLLPKHRTEEIFGRERNDDDALRLAERTGRLNDNGDIDLVDYVMCQAENIRNFCVPEALELTGRRRFTPISYYERKIRWTF